jgi:hypothetical protein
MKQSRFLAGIATLLLLSGCALTLDCTSSPIADRGRCERNNESNRQIVEEQQAKARGPAEKSPGQFDAEDLKNAREE